MLRELVILWLLGGVSCSRNLFGFVLDRGPRQEVSSYGGLAPFWSFPTDDRFVLDSRGIQEKTRGRWSDLDEEMEAAGTELHVSEHEAPRDVPTRPELGEPGGWARGKLPDKKVELGFVPVQIYSQTRRYDAEEHLPRERAADEADDDDELLAAPRLREVLRNKKLHEVYEEEGYEDLGYDHGGYNHHGVKVEGNVKNEEGLYRKKPPSLPPSSDVGTTPSSAGSLSAEQQLESRVVAQVQNNTEDPKDGVNASISDRMDLAEDEPVEPRVMSGGGRRSKVVFPGQSTRRQYTTATDWAGPIVVAPDIPFLVAPTAPQVTQYSVSPTPQIVHHATATTPPQILHHVATFEPSPYIYQSSPASFSSPPTSPAQFASTINAYASLINQNISDPFLQPRPDEFYSLSRSDRKTGSEQTAAIDVSSHNVTRQDSTKPASGSASNHRQSSRRRGASRYREADTNGNSNTQKLPASDSSPSRSTNRKQHSSIVSKKNKIYSNLTRGSSKYGPEDDTQWTPSLEGTQNIRHPSLPIDSREGTSGRHDVTEEPTRIPDQATPTKDPSANAKYVEQLTLAHFSAPVNVNPHQTHVASQDKRLSELARQLNSPQNDDNDDGPKREKRSTAEYSREKYPHYDAPKSISKDSPLKYATDIHAVPKKTYGGMEFYESKENIKCRGPVSPKNVTPRKEEEGEWEENPMPDGERVKGVGDAIDCFKQKFFGKEPLDNPFFKEDIITQDEVRYEAEETLNKGEEEDAVPLSSASISENRKVMFIENPQIFRKDSVSAASEDSEKRSYNSAAESEEFVESEDVSFTTSIPPYYSNNQYSVYESVEEPKIPETFKPYSNDDKSKKENDTTSPPKKNKKTPVKKYVMFPVSVYSIVSTNAIPPYHAPLLIPQHYPPAILSVPVKRDKTVKHSSDGKKDSGEPILYAVPKKFKEKKIIRLITKRNADNGLWEMMNPLKWWWPSMFDSRRDEPRYRRSSDYFVDTPIPPSAPDQPSSETVLAPSQPAIVLTSTGSPISLAEFKVKFNITDPKPAPKKITTRLTGGFINRNADITDAMEDILLKKPTEASTSSTVPTTTVKPKVIFPRAKIPRRKTKPPKKTVNISDPTTEGSPTTTTTTVPPPTTTRMYKPKKIVTKTYGRGPVNVFTVLAASSKESTTRPPSNDPMETSSASGSAAEETSSASGSAAEETSSASGSAAEETVGSPKVLMAPEAREDSGNGTLTYSVDPVSGVGSWGGEQRRWKPKRKRPNRPSVYSYGNATFKSRKTQRDIPRQVRLPESPRKPPPKYILEPDKRRYYYVKV